MECGASAPCTAPREQRSPSLPLPTNPVNCVDASIISAFAVSPPPPGTSLLPTVRQMVYYAVDGQTDGDGTRMFEYVSLFGALSSTFASDTYLVGGIFSAD